MAQITIEVTNEQGQRAQAAFGAYWNLGRDATVAEIKQYLIRQLKAVVVQQERRAAEAAVTTQEYEPS